MGFSNNFNTQYYKKIMIVMVALFTNLPIHHGLYISDSTGRSISRSNAVFKNRNKTLYVEFTLYWEKINICKVIKLYKLLNISFSQKTGYNVMFSARLEATATKWVTEGFYK